MNRLTKTIRNLILIGVLFTLFLSLSGLRLSPVSAHRASEKGIHYGPSEIVKIIDHGSYKHLLCRYGDFISCNTVNRSLLFLWSAGSQVTGFENEKDKPMDYSASYTTTMSKVYGVVNDPTITRVELQLSDGTLLKQDSLYDGLFYFNWQGDNSYYWLDMKLVGFDETGHMVYESESP